MKRLSFYTAESPALWGLILIGLCFFLSSCTLPGIRPQKRYALVYGVSEYDNVPNLPNARGDGEETAQLFASQGIEVLNNNTHGKIRIREFHADLRKARNTLQNGDIFLLYFAGHGFHRLGESVIAFSDFSRRGRGRERASIRASQLLRDLQELSPLYTIVIIDSCNSAGNVNDLPNMSVITASGLSEQSYEWSESVANAVGVSREVRNNGVFTGFFLESATKGDSNGDGAVTLSESFNYIFQQIDSTWNAYYRKSINLRQAVFYPHISGTGIDPVLFTTR